MGLLHWPEPLPVPSATLGVAIQPNIRHWWGSDRLGIHIWMATRVPDHWEPLKHRGGGASPTQARFSFLKKSGFHFLKKMFTGHPCG